MPILNLEVYLYENGDDFKIKCYKHNEGFFIVAYLGNVVLILF